MTGDIEGKFITHYSVDELAQAAADPAECATGFPALEEERYHWFGLQSGPPAFRGRPREPSRFHPMLNRLMLMPKAVIAAINGDCMGGGYQLALACDFRLAADAPYQIGLPEALMSFALGWARTLAKGPPRSIAAIKRAVYLGADRDLESGLYVERCEIRDVMCSEDARTFMVAYNQAAAQDPMVARSEFLTGVGIPKGR